MSNGCNAHGLDRCEECDWGLTGCIIPGAIRDNELWHHPTKAGNTAASAEARAMRHYGAQLAAVNDNDVGAMLERLKYDHDKGGLAKFQADMRIAAVPDLVRRGLLRVLPE